MRAVVAQLLAQPPQAVAELKRLVIDAQTAPLAQQLAAEREAFLRCAVTEDFGARVRAFLDKRR